MISSSRTRRAGHVLAIALLSFILPPPVPAGARAEDEEEPASKGLDPPPPKKAKKKVVADPAEAGDDSSPAGEVRTKDSAPKKLSVDEKYVRENLERYLHATGMQFLDDGRVTVNFAFDEKREEHESLFTPRVARKTGQRFRWSVREEEDTGTSTLYGSTARSDVAQFLKGLRVSDTGAAQLNLWFTDDVEAEIWYVNGTWSSKKQTAAVVFTNDSGKSIGSDHGILCGTYTKGKPGKSTGKFENMQAWGLARVKLVVKDGKFEAWREGRKKESMDYKPKEFASGRIGLVWDNVGGYVHRLDITGKLDIAKMAAEIRKMKK
jgi:hypothetical protein